MTTSNSDQEINQHYGRQDMGATILQALQAAGKDIDALNPVDLAPVDHFHIGGRQATLELIQMAAIAPGMKVLDVGGGFGGAARTLAIEKACHVTVLDLTEEYCRVGEMLTARTGLSERVTFQHGSALNMPFPDAHFDLVWTQHSSMNIANKALLYREIYRVLRPGGRFAFHEVMAGPVQPIHFPVPWAHDQSISFLCLPQEMRMLLAETGFKEVKWLDATASSLDWLRKRNAPQKPRSSAPTTPAPSLNLLFGAEFGKASHNMGRNLEEQRMAVILAVFERA